ncbi:MAG: choice-of-anchor tandem repeat GloVer-containing protein [Candidatus Cybelea sp.]
MLYRFRGGSDGRTPHGLLNVNGTLYGTTTFGGDYSCGAGEGCGTVYSISTSGTEKVLYAFKGASDGTYPIGGLINVSGTLYGTTSGGGTYGQGTVFSVTTSRQETVLHSFAYPPVDGENPETSLVDVNGTLYGTTNYGGAGLYFGTIFSISTSGTEKVLYSFAGGSDGAHPGASVIDVNGTLYGTTSYGGSGCFTSHGLYSGCGTVFAVTTSGQETVLHRFGGSGDGATPIAGLIDVNGALYGTTFNGGAYSGGTVYGISTSGGETTLYSFGGKPGDGDAPLASLLNVNGTLYGTTNYGGRHGHGTVFTLTP